MVPILRLAWWDYEGTKHVETKLKEIHFHYISHYALKDQPAEIPVYKIQVSRLTTIEEFKPQLCEACYSYTKQFNELEEKERFLPENVRLWIFKVP